MTDWSDERNRIQARVLLDSISEHRRIRLTTIEVTLHRFVLAELNTHRVFSRNSASSRAIPVAKQVAKILAHPAIPVKFGGEMKGMQSGASLTGWRLFVARSLWILASKIAALLAITMSKVGVHKSIVNRLIEPFAWHNVIITATEWDGFWHQRCHEKAQPEIQEAAYAMRAAYEASTPTVLKHGEWHTPLIQPEEDEQFWHNEMVKAWKRAEPSESSIQSPVDIRKRVSAARCARVSYLTHDGRRSIEADLELYDFLTTRKEWVEPFQGQLGRLPKDPIHWSPLEHVATPCQCMRVKDEAYRFPFYPEHRGNFDGWDQMRHEVEREMAIAGVQR